MTYTVVVFWFAFVTGSSLKKYFKFDTHISLTDIK